MRVGYRLGDKSGKEGREERKQEKFGEGKARYMRDEKRGITEPARESESERGYSPFLRSLVLISSCCLSLSLSLSRSLLGSISRGVLGRLLFLVLHSEMADLRRTSATCRSGIIWCLFGPTRHSEGSYSSLAIFFPPSSQPDVRDQLVFLAERRRRPVALRSKSKS